MKAKNYREIKGQSYTRKKYIRGPPTPKIVKFTMGDPTQTYDYKVFLIAKEAAQIRHVALEAGRIATNRFLQLKLGKNYVFRILPYPHIILRENKMIFGAHADRLQDGMKDSFGKAVDRAARVRRKQPLMVVEVNEKGVQVAKEALKRGGAKMPVPCRVVIEEPAKKEVVAV